MEQPIIGIDLGTTNCAVAKYERGRTKVLPIMGKLTTPSVLYFNGDEVKVGQDAKKYIALHPDRCLASTKRDMGTNKVYHIAGKDVTPVYAASMILKYLKQKTEEYLNTICNDVVITVPAYFGFNERNATREAAVNAGWNPLALLDEPTAAAIVYAQNRGRDSLNVVVDLGGGTFDVTVLQYTNENGKAVYKPIKVGGNHRLGGDDFDNAIVKYMIDEGAQGYTTELELKEEAERAKIALCTSDVVPIQCQYVDTTLTRDQYRDLIQSYLEEICQTIKDTVAGAGKTFDDIDRFILVGGSCKHPVVKAAIAQCVGREPYSADNLDTAVAEGAALDHHFLKQVGTGEPTGKVENICPKTLGTDLLMLYTMEQVNVVLVREGTPIPYKMAQLAAFQYVKAETYVLEGDAHLAQDCKKLGKLTMQMKYPNVRHAIVRVFDIDASGCLTFFGHEIKPGADISSMEANVSDDLCLDYTTWKEWKKQHPGEYETIELKLNVK